MITVFLIALAMQAGGLPRAGAPAANDRNVCVAERDKDGRVTGRKVCQTVSQWKSVVRKAGRNAGERQYENTTGMGLPNDNTYNTRQYLPDAYTRPPANTENVTRPR